MEAANAIQRRQSVEELSKDVLASAISSALTSEELISFAEINNADLAAILAVAAGEDAQMASPAKPVKRQRKKPVSAKRMMSSMSVAKKMKRPAARNVGATMKAKATVKKMIAPHKSASKMSIGRTGEKVISTLEKAMNVTSEVLDGWLKHNREHQMPATPERDEAVSIVQAGVAKHLMMLKVKQDLIAAYSTNDKKFAVSHEQLACAVASCVALTLGY